MSLQEFRELIPKKCYFCHVLSNRQEKAKGVSQKKKNLNDKTCEERIILGFCYATVKKKHTDFVFLHFHINFIQKGHSYLGIKQ